MATKNLISNSIPTGTPYPGQTSKPKGRIPVPRYPCNPVPPYPIEPPGPEPEVSAFINKTEKERYDRAFITVEHYSDLKSLEDRDLHNGKIVCVMDVGGEMKFYQYIDGQGWQDIIFTAEVEPITDEEIDEICKT